MSKTDDGIENLDDAETPEASLEDTNLTADEFDEETIPEEDGKPVRKKVAALKARHALEDYFESKKIRHELDYLLEEEEEKRAK